MTPAPFVALLILFYAVAAWILYWLVEEHREFESRDATLRIAETISDAVQDAWRFQTRMVSSSEAEGLPATIHGLQRIAGAVRLPQTDIQSLPGDEAPRAGFRVLSDRPFPQSAASMLDDWQKEALARLRADPDGVVFRFEEGDAGRVLRFVSALRMTEGCIGCHNVDPNSPFQAWQIGDVGGIQEVRLPVVGAAMGDEDQDTSFRNIVLFVVAALMATTGFVLFLLRRNRQAFDGLKRMTVEQARRTEELECSSRRLEDGLARLNAVLENVADAIVTIDEHGIVDSANPATERIFGYSRGDLLGCHLSILVQVPSGEDEAALVAKCLETGSVEALAIGGELRGRRSNGSVFPLDLSIGEYTLGERRLFTGILRDVSERARVEKALRESERLARRLSMVAARTDNGVVITNADGRIEWVNEAFEAISGYTLQEISGARPGSFLQGDGTDRGVVERIRKALDQGRGFNVEILNYRKSGEPYWVQIDAQPVRKADGEIEYFIAIEREVSEAKDRERELENARARAEEGSLAKSRFLAVISHEIRTPLNGVLGALGLLEEDKLAAEQKQFVDIARKAADNLLGTINDVLDVSKMEADRLDLEPSVMHIRQVVGDIIDFMAPKANEKALGLIAELDPSLPDYIVADPARLRQILLNLLSNGIKFTSQGGVSVRVDKIHQRTGRVVARFEVVDTGPGIDDDELVYVFDEFWASGTATAGRIQGTGLGLAICKRLVELMDGRIGVNSQSPYGSTFWFEVPCIVPTAAEIEAAVSADAVGKEAPEEGVRFDNRLLVAEDNSANQLIIRAMLERLGAQVDIVADGNEAVAAVAARPYDLVLMDINMPELDGIGATREIRALEGDAARVPIIAMTAHVMRGDREDILAEGLDDYLAKPVNRTSLRAVLSRWLQPRAVEASSPHAADQLTDDDNDSERLDQPSTEPDGSPDGSDPAVDRTMVDELREVSGDALVQEVIGLFKAECDKRIIVMRDAVATGEAQPIKANAHAIKSSAASLGAMRLSALCAEAEIEEDPARRDELVAMIGLEADRALAELKRL
ncbi:MAG: PAS domain S-box protein [Alphaproteobacteria bacterium]|nr:PAS domain S-box protein [Alphaproteobacteria bacterium]